MRNWRFFGALYVIMHMETYKEKSMKKRFLFLLIVLAAFCLLCGCNEAKSPSGVQTPDGTVPEEPAAEACLHPRATAVRTEPTCTEAGSAAYTCPDCGKTWTDVLAAAGHDYERSDESVLPTCFTAILILIEYLIILKIFNMSIKIKIYF